MNKLLNRYIILNYLKVILNFILVFFSLGTLLALFQEVEFFKDLEVGIAKPITLAITFVPNELIKMLPFVIFLATMWYLVNINNNKELISLKIFGFSNSKIIFLLSSTVFILSILITLFVNPITSSMVKYYENEKSKYARDVDHLISINKNGVWIKEKSQKFLNLVYAKELKSNFLFDITIYKYEMSENNLIRIESENADISDNKWILNNVKIYNSNQPEKIFQEERYNYSSVYNLNKINSSYKNLDTISFINLINNY